MRPNLLNKGTMTVCFRQTGVRAMKIHLSTLIFSCFALAICLGGSAYADTLLIQRVKQERGAHLPTRGMSMAQVEREFGAPASKLTLKAAMRHSIPSSIAGPMPTLPFTSSTPT